MNKVYKITNIALIFMLLIACQEIYALRVPMNGHEKVRKALIDEDLKISKSPASPSKVLNTYFFRHWRTNPNRKAFEIFVDDLINTIKKGENIRVLSGGCSTGEEAYTIAIMLLEKGIEPEKFSIIGVDSKTWCINIATKGVYSDKSLAHILNSPLLDKYFSKISDNSYKINQEVKDIVKFKICDLTDADAVVKLGVFNGIIFKLVAYQMSEKGRRQAYKNIAMISKDGAIFLADSADSTKMIFVKNNHSKTGFKVHFKNELIWKNNLTEISTIPIGQSVEPKSTRRTKTTSL